ncbi:MULTISPECIES: hypothetical protein [Haloferax]|uniref:Uncharacterized protein n=1 Tax=Haloferax marinum TaxID=2666143 RepID=A0A6A8GC01_9EURY|nr:MULTISPECIES: hypothetical protein [Haloferax]KAB1190672.1 hypothetical protein Hfx1150_16675 [Haloferax sp. CBA1150]MRW98202.1 hypothetical protein [Haloferax marinum]
MIDGPPPTDALRPTETYDGRITVRLMDDEDGIEEISCSSYGDAIETVKEHRDDVTAAKIIDRDDVVVFTSAEMDIDVWETMWENEKRSMRVSVEEHDCPYDSVSCFADDLCVQCQMDEIQSRW